jgi:phosphotransferase system HPr-like phosphotransfer protein
MRIRGLIQSTVVDELTAEADDAQAARARIEGQVPDGYELIQVHNAMPRGGRVIATGRIRSATTQDIEAEGPDYRSARAALEAAIPEDHRLLYVLSVD